MIELPIHPDCHAIKWTDAELRAIRTYGDQRAAGAREQMRDRGELLLLLKCARVALAYHQAQTRPINTTIETLANIDAKLANMVNHCCCDACKDGTMHASDCSVHNMPHSYNSTCDCEPS